MHPWCRSTTIAVINREWLKDMKRKARDPVTGRVIEVPMSMSYQDWYKEYVEGKQISVKSCLMAGLDISILNVYLLLNLQNSL